MECKSDEVLLILSANYGRKSSSICPGANTANVVCSSPNSFNIVKNECNAKRRCRIFAGNSIFGPVCNNIPKYLEVKYECVKRPVQENPCKDNPCGLGAICTNKNGMPICTCPAGKSGDPKQRCCKSLRCG